MNLLIFTATREEAAPVISRLKNAKKNKVGNFKGWQGTFEDNIDVQLFCTGIGVKKINVPVPNDSIILNIGIAGALNKKIKIGDWFSVSKVSDIKCNVVEGMATATLITAEKPVLNACEGKKIDADLVDLEGLAVTEFARKNNFSCYILKMVSDFADENSSDVYKKSLKIYYQTCFEKLQIFIENEIKRNSD